MEYVYGFTSDNEKVIIGTVEEAVKTPTSFTATSVANTGSKPQGVVAISYNNGSSESYSYSISVPPGSSGYTISSEAPGTFEFSRMFELSYYYTYTENGVTTGDSVLIIPGK